MAPIEMWSGTAWSAGAQAADWPDASNTGVQSGVTLQVVPDDVTSGTGWSWDSNDSIVRINDDAAVLDSLDISSQVYNSSNQFAGMSVTNCKIRGTNVGHGIFALMLGPSATVKHCEFGGCADGVTYSEANMIQAAADSTDALPTLIDYCHFHHALHFVHFNGDYTNISNCHGHDESMGETGTGTDHSECLYIVSGQHITVKHNSFAGGNTAVIWGQNYPDTAGGTGHVLIDDNRISSELHSNGEYCSSAIAIENKDIQGSITVTNNVIDTYDSSGSYPHPYPWSTFPIRLPEGSTVTGNTYADGTAIPTSDITLETVVY